MQGPKMNVIDVEKIKQSTSGDEGIMIDIINLGLERIEKSQSEIQETLEKEDWNELARIIHKLRPVLHFVGIVTLEDDLVAIEKNAKDRTNLAKLGDKFATIFQIFDSAKHELEEFRNTLKRD